MELSSKVWILASFSYTDNQGSALCKVASSLCDLDLILFFKLENRFFFFKFQVYLPSISYVWCTELGALGGKMHKSKLLESLGT